MASAARKLLVSAMLMTASMSVDGAAFADDGAPPAAGAGIGDGMRGYYQSEETTAYTFVGVGAASAAAGGILLTRPGDLARGLGGSLLALGVLEAAGAAFYAFQVDAEVEHYSATLARDPSAFKREEATHIHGTTTRFFAYRLGELALAVGGAGVATYGFAKDQDLWKGVGIGVAAEALTFFVLDAFGQARARAYEDEVQRFQPTIAVQVGGGDRPTTIGMSARF
jgi:hypothetical protein